MRHVLTKCGDELTRDNLAAGRQRMKDFVAPLLLPGVKINTSPTDFYPIQSVPGALRWRETWKLFGDVISADT